MVGEGITVRIDADGSQMFVDGSDNLFQVLDDLEAQVEAAQAVEGDPLDQRHIHAALHDEIFDQRYLGRYRAQVHTGAVQHDEGPGRVGRNAVRHQARNTGHAERHADA